MYSHELTRSISVIDLNEILIENINWYSFHAIINNLFEMLAVRKINLTD